MKCKICQNETKHVQTLKVREKYDADYYLCGHCGFLFIGNPTWLDEAYNESINSTDTGYVLRNVYLSRKVMVLFYFLFGDKHTYLDYAGGYGVFSRLMRDYGFNFLLSDRYTPNLFMKGFEYTNEKIKALTCFECFEHFSDPDKEIAELFSLSSNIFFSTALFSGEVVPPETWEYYGLHHGQHVGFYSQKTLSYIAQKYGVHVYSNGDSLHLFTKKNISRYYFRLLLSLTTFQVDVLLRKLLKSKTGTDSLFLVKKGMK